MLHRPQSNANQTQATCLHETAASARLVYLFPSRLFDLFGVYQTTRVWFACPHCSLISSNSNFSELKAPIAFSLRPNISKAEKAQTDRPL